MDQHRLVQLLEGVLAPDTDRVKAATAELRSDFFAHPESLPLLLQILISHDTPQVRQLAATQARSLVPKHWKGLPTGQKSQIREHLLQSTLNEAAPLVRHSSARVIATIAKIDIETGEWIDLPKLAQHAAVSSNPHQREVSTYLLYTVLESMGDGFMHRFQEFFGLFSQTIRDPESAEVRINTVMALGKMAVLIDADEDGDSVESFRQMVPQMVSVLKQAVDENDEDRTMQGFEVFQTLLGCDSRLLSNHFKDLLHFMIELACQQSLDEDARTQAINWLMQAVRFRKLKIQGMKVGEQLTLKCLEIATEMDEDSVDSDDTTVARSALGLIDLLASNLPPSQVVVPLLHALGSYINSQDINRRCAGILALGVCTEGAPDFISTQLQEILPTILRLLADPEVRVRQVTLLTVVRLADELPEDMGKEHGKLIPALGKNLVAAINSYIDNSKDDSPADTIKHSCNAIEAIMEGLEVEDVKPYLHILIPQLTRLFEHPDLSLRSSAIGAVGSIASSAEQEFLPYFEDIMNQLSGYVSVKDSEDEMNLRCVTCDAMGNMALAVGREPFQRYVRPLMEATEEGLHLDHSKLRETSYMFWGTMAKIYETDFKPFLQGVVKGLFDSLEQEENDLEIELGEEAADLVGQEVNIGGRKVKVAAAGDNDESISDGVEALEDDDDDDSEDWDDVTAVTAAALEKEVALEVIGDVLANTKMEFLPYLEKTLEIVVPFIEHPYEGMRRAAISALYRAYASLWRLQSDAKQSWKPGLPLKAQPNAEVMKLGNVVMTATLTLAPEEEDRETLVEVSRNIAATLKLCGPAIISEENVLSQVTKLVVDIITKKHPCQQDMGDADDVDISQESSEWDWYLIDNALEVIMGLANALGEDFGQLWKIFEKPIMQYASSSERLERSNAIGTIAECVKSMGNSVTPYTTGLLKILLHRLGDEDAETKSNAAFAIGVLQENSTKDQEILKSFPTILNKLEPLLQMQEARALDNAAGCISRMIMRHPSHVPLSDALTTLIPLLPLKEDYEENEPIYRMIFKLYRANNEQIISITPNLVPIFSQVLGPPSGQLLDETRKQLIDLVTFLHGKYPALIQQHPSLIGAMQEHEEE